jgi:hypothetical protein
VRWLPRAASGLLLRDLLYRLAISIAVVAACSAKRPVDNAPDAGQGSAVAVDAPASTAITISGMTLDQYGYFLPNVTVAAFTPSGASAGTAVTSDGSGAFSMTVELTGGQFTGYLAASNGSIVTHAWPLATLTAAPSAVSIHVFDGAATLAQIFTICGDHDSSFVYNPADGLIAVEVADVVNGSFAPVSGAGIFAPPGATTVCYLSQQPDGVEQPSLMYGETDHSGMAFILNTPASDSVPLLAGAVGYSFSPTDVPVAAGVLTTTLVIGQ